MNLTRRNLLKLGGLGALSGLTGGCDFGSMFALPPRETLYFTPNDKFYVVNYSKSPFNITRDLDQDIIAESQFKFAKYQIGSGTLICVQFRTAAVFNNQVFTIRDPFQ